MRKNTDESGVVIVEMALYFPLVLLAYVTFIIISLYLTQRIVLDRAVAQVCLEAASWLGDDMKKYDVTDPFAGNEIKVRADPYVNTIAGLINPYDPMGKDAFINKVKEKINHYARWSFMGGRYKTSPLTIDVNYDENYFVCRVLKVNAVQRITFPINLSFIGLNFSTWEFRSTAKATVFHTGALINDVDFIFDTARIVTGGKADLQNLRSTVGDLPNLINNWLVDKLKGSLKLF